MRIDQDSSLQLQTELLVEHSDDLTQTIDHCTSIISQMKKACGPGQWELKTPRSRSWFVWDGKPFLLMSIYGQIHHVVSVDCIRMVIEMKPLPKLVEKLPALPAPPNYTEVSVVEILPPDGLPAGVLLETRPNNEITREEDIITDQEHAAWLAEG